jgi:hypothetical protein
VELCVAGVSDSHSVCNINKYTPALMDEPDWSANSTVKPIGTIITQLVVSNRLSQTVGLLSV